VQDRELYAKLLGIITPWGVEGVELDMKAREVVVRVDVVDDAALRCPTCLESCSRYDTRERRWRHLDTMQMKTILVAKVPRVKCEAHGVHQVPVPWSEPNSRFTAMFEALVIDWLKEASTSGVARLLGLSWDEVDGIMQRAVTRGLVRRGPVLAPRIGVDETSFAKRHEYVTVVNDLDQRRVLYVADGRGKDSLRGFYDQFSHEALEQVKVVAMDMHAPFIIATHEAVPRAESKIAFDKFHVAKHLGDAVDQVRRAESKQLRLVGDDCLVGTRYAWLSNPEEMPEQKWDEFESLRTSTLRTARAWALKEEAMSLWSPRLGGFARAAWSSWYAWAIRSRLEPMKRVARMVKGHLAGILVAIRQRVSNAKAEGTNSVIQAVKYRARGFRNRALVTC
jgi:transposase